MKILKNKQLNAESYSVFSIKSKNKRHLSLIGMVIIGPHVYLYIRNYFSASNKNTDVNNFKFTSIQITNVVRNN